MDRNTLPNVPMATGDLRECTPAHLHENIYRSRCTIVHDDLLVIGDRIQFTEPVWAPWVRRGRQGSPIGERTVEAEVMRCSIGSTTGVRTLSLRVTCSTGEQALEYSQRIRRQAAKLFQRGSVSRRDWRAPALRLQIVKATREEIAAKRSAV